MENKINVYELLKDCPKGMEFDSPVWNNIVFEEIDEDNIVIFRKSVDAKVYLTQYGEVNSIDGKCIIFPKGKTTWDGFVPPCKFKDGDIITDSLGTCIFKGESEFEGCVDYYCGISNGCFSVKDDKCNTSGHYGFIVNYRLSTEEEKQELFDAIKENGYKWNAETKTLEKLTIPKFKVGDVIINIYRKYLNCDSKGGKISKIIDDKYIFDTGSYTHIQCQDNYELVHSKLVEPKFKVGNRIRHKNDENIINTIGCVYHDSYGLCDGHILYFKEEDQYELYPYKFDITTLVPFESKVLVRDCDQYEWEGEIFTRYAKSFNNSNFVTLGGESWKQCIPYNDDTKHLLGKTDDCDEYFKNW
jgi:hypothetical protein